MSPFSTIYSFLFFFFISIKILEIASSTIYNLKIIGIMHAFTFIFFISYAFVIITECACILNNWLLFMN